MQYTTTLDHIFVKNLAAGSFFTIEIRRPLRAFKFRSMRSSPKLVMGMLLAFSQGRCYPKSISENFLPVSEGPLRRPGGRVCVAA